MENEEMQKAVFEISMMENRLKQLDQNLSMIEQQIMEHERIENSLNELGKEKNSDMIFPIGAGVFANGNLKDSESLLVSIGSGIVIEKNLAETNLIISKRKEKLVSLREELGGQMKILVEAMARIEQALRIESEKK